MKKPYTKLFCALIALTFLIMPAAAFAEGEEAPASFTIGNKLTSFVTVPVPGLDISDLLLNDIKYEAQSAPGGGIQLYSIDLAAAAGVRKAVDEYNKRNPDEPFDQKATPIIKAGVGVSLIDKKTTGTLPSRDAADTILKNQALFSTVLRAEYSRSLMIALSSIAKSVYRVDKELATRIEAIIDNFHATERRFSQSMKDIYLCLYDMRAAIAAGELPSELLTQASSRDMLKLFREVLSEAGLDLDEIGFWDKDAAWTAWAIENSDPSKGDVALLKGNTFIIGDGKGNTLPIQVGHVKSTSYTAPVKKNRQDPVGEVDIESDFFEEPAHLPLRCPIDTIYFTALCEALDGVAGVVYDWEGRNIPVGLEFEDVPDVPNGKALVGTPTVAQVTKDVTVGVWATTPSDQTYYGSHTFEIVVVDNGDADMRDEMGLDE